MSNIWTINNNYSLGVIVEESSYEYQFPTSVTGVTFKLISGEIPDGIAIEGEYLRGRPSQVARLTDYKFVIRATYGNLISDRTFLVQVVGPDQPKWITYPGQLPVGLQQTYFILDESYIDFQLIAQDEDLLAGQQLRFWIPSNGGLLPPGVTLSETGRLYGWIKPLQIITKPKAKGFYGTTLYDTNGYDYGVSTVEAYDSFMYDANKFDYSTEFAKPIKFNRNYEFIVVVTDGDTSIRRKFSIYVIGDAITADTTGIFSDEWPITVDNAFVREPVWKTPSDLGVFRASNYYTHKLEIYETVDNNPVKYFLNTLNPDGTLSLLPPGVQLDSVTADIFGVIPYQPAITKTYTFTITAVRLGHLQKVLMDSESPIVINDNYVIYRNTSLEGTEVSRVYSSLYYIEHTTGIIISGRVNDTGQYIWEYDNLDTKEKLYFITDVDLPYESPTWYSTNIFDSAHIISSHPAIDKLQTQNSVYADYESAKSSRTFTLDVIGEIDSIIRWHTPADLGTIEAEQISTLSIFANSSLNDTLVYEILDPDTKLNVEVLPYGLTLSSYGNIVGKVIQFTDETDTGLTSFFQGDEQGNQLYPIVFDDDTTTFDREFRFEVTAFNNSKTVSSSRIFTLKVLTPNDKLYCDIRCVPMLNPQQRDLYQKFITNRDIFEYDAIYRQEDPNFGIKTDLSMLIYAGAEIQYLQKYYELITKRKRFKFGDVKIATARVTGTIDVIYEVVYVEMIDPLENSNGHLPNVINTSRQCDPITIDNNITSLGQFDTTKKYYPDDIIRYDGTLYQVLKETTGNIPSGSSQYYKLYSDTTVEIDNSTILINDSYSKYKFPSSISLWREEIEALGEHDRNYLPLWMRTIQDGSMTELDYVPAVVLCYCKPGYAYTIVQNIKNSNFNFNDINYDIDRFIINRVLGNLKDTFLIFRNDRTISQ